MKASELRIGNYIEAYPYGIVKVEIISNKEPLYLNIKTCPSLSGATSSGQYHPIPLTEEWLVKFGFEKEKDVVGVQWKLKGFYISECFPSKHHTNTLKLTLRFSQKKAIEYVHQLQNIYFALTGEELTIKP